MTNEEAIHRIQEHMRVHKIGQYPHVLIKEALDMAITALQEQQVCRKPLRAFLEPMDRYKGLKGKFLVFKSDTGEMIKNCFVLRPDKDPAAVAALRAYAAATDNDTLATDIIEWVGEGSNEPLTLDELRKMLGEPVFIVDLVHKSDPSVADLWGGWIVFTNHNENGFIPRGGGFFSNYWYGKNWIAYRSKPKGDAT